MGEYSCLALQLGDGRGFEKEVEAVRKAGVPTLQQLAYFQELIPNGLLAVSEASKLLVHVAALSVHISSSSEGHTELVETWQTIVKILNMGVDEEDIGDRDLSRVALDKCVKWGLMEPLTKGMVEECKTLAKKGVNFNMPRVYRVSGWLVRHASTMLESSTLATLLNMVAPQCALADDWKPKVEELSSIALALPDFVRGLVSLEDFQSNSTAHRYLGDILEIYIRVSQWPADNRHPFAFLLTAEVEEQVRGVVLVKLLDLAMKGSRLKKNWGVTTNVLKLIRLNVSSSLVMLQVQTIFFPFLLNLVARNDSLVGDVKNQKNPRLCALDLLFFFVKQESSSVLDLLKEHVVKDLCGDYPRKFDLLSRFVRMRPELGRPLIKPLQAEVERIDKQRGGIPDLKLKNHLQNFEDAVYNGL